jgi:hypothetical protein
MNTKKLFAGTSLALVLMASAVAVWAAVQENWSGQSCGSQTGTWHFVNNQTGGAAPGTLYATWNGGATICQAPASAVNKNTQHFYCTASGALDQGAYTNLPGRLVLSDFSCSTPTPPPPPPCDPSKDKDCK